MEAPWRQFLQRDRLRAAEQEPAPAEPAAGCLQQKAGARLPLLAGNSKEQGWKRFSAGIWAY